LDFIQRYTAENGYPPSVREVGASVGIKSTATVYHYISLLRDKGLLNKTDNKKRAVSLSSGAVNIPLLGTVTAGQPIFAYENYEDYYALPSAEFGSGELFMLRVQGTSMIDAGIQNGDKIIVHRQQSADDGEIVVALVEDSATVKRLFHRNGKIILHPENEEYSDIVLDEVIILGKVVGLVRSF
ncbi:MAG: transcriptional repressor LexA, partial [Christensenellaceae bacterium]